MAPGPGPGPGPGLGSLALRLLLPLACGLGPLGCFRRPPGPPSPLLPLLSCFAGGVFLGTALLELLPSALCSLGAALQGLSLSPQFPLPAFILALGFLLPPLLEPIAMEPLAPPLPFIPPPAPPPPCSPAHSMALLLALGLREAEAGPGLSPALLLHSGALGAGLALRMLSAGLRPPAVAAALLVLAGGAALGAAPGAALGGARAGLARAVLRGLAAGAFLYVTAREAPPPELREPRLRMRGALLLLAGFALVCGALLARERGPLTPDL
ncbi:zinc transporter ZIP1-like [Neopsephotus bourkii]|uniref:zinc transporter ZIP1-like n=1 Tax=Neopsephotus bourkii TaxID=309878 RepID=UPI002AA5A9BD|nr:zinc transporter ZIP1-like [Neopsephotus bourkii]